MRFSLAILLAALLISTAFAGSRRSKTERIQPGDFDYYILSLSWAPDFCERPDAQRDPQECAPGRRLGFVVHGLWPQLDDGGHPSQCAPARPVAEDIVRRALTLIPSEGLVQHEWRDHGTCSGMSTAAYFETVRRAYDSITIPTDFRPLTRRLEASPRQIAAKFQQVNPRLKDAIRVSCSSGELSEVRICLAKDLAPRACSVHDTQCPAPRIAMQPVH